MKQIKCVCSKTLLEYDDMIFFTEVKKRMNKLYKEGKITKWRLWIENKPNPNIMNYEDLYFCNDCFEKVSDKIMKAKKPISHIVIFNKYRKKLHRLNKARFKFGKNIR